jgi:hypothetical protein
MTQKDKIKIDSFKVDKMRQNDIKDVLKLAIAGQSSFGITDKKAPSLFFQEVNSLIENNMNYSFVFKNDLNKVFAAFIIKPQTNISAELALVVSDPKIIQTQEMYESFLNCMKAMRFKMFLVKAYKRRKRFEVYVKFLNKLGFNEITADDEDFLTLCLKKS